MRSISLGGRISPTTLKTESSFECIPNLLQLFEEPLEDVTFDGVRRDEVEDEAVLRLEVTMDSSHPLLQPIRVPRDVVIEQDVAALEVDAFTCRLGRDENLSRALAELLFGVEPRSGVVTGTDVHPAVNRADRESPLLAASSRDSRACP